MQAAIFLMLRRNSSVIGGWLVIISILFLLWITVYRHSFGMSHDFGHSVSSILNIAMFIYIIEMTVMNKVSHLQPKRFNHPCTSYHPDLIK